MSALAGAADAAPFPPLHAELWRADALSASAQPVLASGHAALDAVLPGGGWPVGGLCEVLQPPGQCCEWRLLLPTLARSGSGAVVLVGPQLPPFAPAWAAQGVAVQRLVWLALDGCTVAQRLWAAEQALRAAGVDAVLLFLPGPAQPEQAAQLRRLHLASVQQGCLFFALRTHSARQQASAAVLRLALALGQPPGEQAADPPLWVEVFKRRGPPLTQAVPLQARTGPVAVVLATGGAHVVGGAAHAA